NSKLTATPQPRYLLHHYADCTLHTFRQRIQGCVAWAFSRYQLAFNNYAFSSRHDCLLTDLPWLRSLFCEFSLVQLTVLTEHIEDGRLDTYCLQSPSSRHAVEASQFE